MALQLAHFRFDITPPLGHSLCGGWIPSARSIADPLDAIGLVFLGAGDPIVLCALDWTGLCNESHLKFRQVLAEAARTRASRVAVQCVHQHDAPFVCLDTDRIIRAQGDLPPNCDPAFFATCLERARSSLRAALAQARPLTHVAAAQAVVHDIASNRRILANRGKIERNRSVAPSSDDLRGLPDGTIDPTLKVVAFYHGDTKLAACYYYAVHPISYCCTEGRVSGEFVADARRLREAHDDPGSAHLYFTGCAGDINTGKYNSSADRANRGRLAGRLYQAMESASARLKPRPVDSLRWSSDDLLPPARRDLDATVLAAQVADKSRRVVLRNRPAFALAWLQRLERRLPLTLGALHANEITVLHLPGEPFIDYQLAARVRYPDRFVAVAAYGDGGPWYIPTAAAYAQGGYEVGVAYCDPRIETLLWQGVDRLMESR